MAMERLSVSTSKNCQIIDITRQIQQVLNKTGISEGHVVIYSPHTTAGITINENADPDVKDDIIMELNKIVPFQDGYAHMEGNSAAHIKASMMGFSQLIPVHNSEMTLGTWQGIYFCEFDGPRSRNVLVQVVGS